MASKWKKIDKDEELPIGAIWSHSNNLDAWECAYLRIKGRDVELEFDVLGVSLSDFVVRGFDWDSASADVYLYLGEK